MHGVSKLNATESITLVSFTKVPADFSYMSVFFEEVAKRGLHNVMVTQTGCIGICKFEPVVEVFETDGKKTTYVKMTAEKMVRVINDHIVNGNVVTEYTIGANA